MSYSESEMRRTLLCNDCRIFYVSHDSQDMKIFSYITRELPDSTFRCNVFKAYKKVCGSHPSTYRHKVCVSMYNYKPCLSVVLFPCLKKYFFKIFCLFRMWLQNMALHIVRSLGQAFDVCHRLNPRPKKTKKEGEQAEGEGEKKEEETAEETAGKEEEKAVANGSSELGADLSAALKDISLQDVGKKTESTQQNDLMGLDFDPFCFNFEVPGGAGTKPNGAPQGAFGSGFAGGGGGGGEAGPFPPLMVSNNPSGFPDLPVGSTSAQTQLHLMGRPRPRPAGSSNQQVSNIPRSGEKYLAKPTFIPFVYFLWSKMIMTIHINFR